MEDLKTDRKGADWKVALAIHLRKQHLVPHRWLADNLSMGKPSFVQSCVSNKREDTEVLKWLQKLENHGNLDRPPAMGLGARYFPAELATAYIR